MKYNYGLYWYEYNKKGVLVVKDKFFPNPSLRLRFSDKLSDRENYFTIIGFIDR